MVHTRTFVALLVSECTRNSFPLLLGSLNGVGAQLWRNGNFHRCENTTHCNSWELSLNQHILRFCKSLNLLLKKKKSQNLSTLFDCKRIYWKCASFSFRNQSLFDWSSFSHNQLMQLTLQTFSNSFYFSRKKIYKSWRDVSFSKVICSGF